MVQNIFSAVHLKYHLIQLFCCHILVIAVQGEAQTRFVQFVQVPNVVNIIENANDTMLNSFEKVGSPLECFQLCSKHDNCKSVFIYKEEHNVCQLRSSVLSDMIEPVAKAEARYYKRVENTQDPLSCGEGLFECDTKLCIAEDARCDLINDCGDWSDEVGCSCPSNTLQCNIGACIPSYFRCNGVADFDDGSDEPADCSSCDGSLCTDDTCIHDWWVCDNYDYCGDNSDEMGCIAIDCKADQFICADGTCIPLPWMCDGFVDCADDSDEYLC